MDRFRMAELARYAILTIVVSSDLDFILRLRTSPDNRAWRAISAASLPNPSSGDAEASPRMNRTRWPTATGPFMATSPRFSMAYNGAIILRGRSGMAQREPSIDQWLAEAKQDRTRRCGMYLTHNGIVRITPKKQVRRGVEGLERSPRWNSPTTRPAWRAAVQEALTWPGVNTTCARGWLRACSTWATPSCACSSSATSDRTLVTLRRSWWAKIRERPRGGKRSTRKAKAADTAGVSEKVSLRETARKGDPAT